MPSPNLINAVSVQIKPLDKPNTVFDQRTRQPVKHVARSATVTLTAQVQWTSLNKGRASHAGIIMDADGYLIFRKIDLEAAAYSPGHGDKLISVGSQTGLELYITSLEPCGHYGGDYTLLLARFADRRPGKGAS